MKITTTNSNSKSTKMEIINLDSIKGGRGFRASNIEDMLDSSGDPFGEQQEFEVSVDGLEA